MTKLAKYLKSSAGLVVAIVALLIFAGALRSDLAGIYVKDCK